MTALEEAATAVGFLLLPSLVITILFGRRPDTALGLLVARVIGAPLLALSFACWRASNDSAAHAASVLVSAMLVYDTIASLLLVYAGVRLGLTGIGLWPAVLVHLALAGWCLVALQRNDHVPSNPGAGQ